MSEKLLHIEDLHVEVEGREILKGLNLSLDKGDIHAIMGPNGSGKSTLAYALAGRPGYEVTDGGASFDGADLIAMEPHERAAAGAGARAKAPVTASTVSAAKDVRVRTVIVIPGRSLPPPGRAIPPR